MSSAPPPSFVDLNTASFRLNAEVSVMGTVTDFLPAGRSRGTDWMCSFSIMDPSYSGLYSEGLKVRYFRPMESELPMIRGIGEIVLLRSLKIKEYSGMTIGLSTRATTWVLFQASSMQAIGPKSPLKINHVKEARAPLPTLLEMQYALTLHNSQDHSILTQAPTTFTSTMASPPSNGQASQTQIRREKFSLVKDLACDTFHDLVGQVVKTYSHSDRVELYLTDYTTNPLLFNYEWGQDEENGTVREEDSYNYLPPTSSAKAWPGPFGKMTLTVTLWPPHAYFARQNLKENDYVQLRNVRIKFSNDAKLEGVLHSDRRYPDRIDVTVLGTNESDDRLKDVLRRKREYVKKFEKSSADFIAEARGSKRKAMDETKLLSRAQKKKRKQERERLAKQRKGPAVEQDEDRNPGDVNQQQLNHINCSNHLVAPRPLSSITSLKRHVNVTPAGTSYDLPFQNTKSRATVRIIDFYPPNLIDFAAPCPKSTEFDVLSDAGDSGSESENESHSSVGNSDYGDRQWEWRFSLKLEDAIGPKDEDKATIDAYVAGPDAECLLKLDAENLRKSPKALATLREKLFLLWGDLEEQKGQRLKAPKQSNGNSSVPKPDEVPRSKPFTCCLKEYGVKNRKKVGSKAEEDSESELSQEKDDWVWERRWRVFGTTII